MLGYMLNSPLLRTRAVFFSSSISLSSFKCFTPSAALESFKIIIAKIFPNVFFPLALCHIISVPKNKQEKKKMLNSVKSLNLVRLLKAIPLHSTMTTNTGMYIAYGLSLVGNTCNGANLHNVGACKEVNYVLHHSKGHSFQWNMCARSIRPWFTNNLLNL